MVLSIRSKGGSTFKHDEIEDELRTLVWHMRAHNVAVDIAVLRAVFLMVQASGPQEISMKGGISQ